MDSGLSHALTAALLFLILSSRFAIGAVRRFLGLTDDMSLLARTAIFALLVTSTTLM
jgi:hypothetical protein